MKTAKLTLGIISIVLSFVILFQSCATGIGTAMANDTKDFSSGTGVFVAILLIAAGIVGIAARNSKGGAIAATIVYALSGIIGVSSTGAFKDLLVWGIISFIFAAVFLLSVFVGQTYAPKAEKAQPEGSNHPNDKSV